jgi:transcriptional regulator with XRE-family HTH domain
MSVHEKIRLARHAKGWTQEDVADKLEMSINGYGDIERGDSDIKLSKLEKIADLFDMTLSDLIGINEQNSFFQTGSNNIQSQCFYGSCSPEYLQLKAECEKEHLLNGEKDKEIALLKELVDLLKHKNAS